MGHALNVHEGPTGLGTRIEYNNVKLAAGMVLSNEPGYYEPGKCELWWFVVRSSSFAMVVLRVMKGIR